MQNHLDPYAVLHVAREATEQEIRAAYRREMLTPPISSARLLELRAAYELLIDVDRRRAWDAENRPPVEPASAKDGTFAPWFLVDPANGGRVRTPFDLGGSVMKATELMMDVLGADAPAGEADDDDDDDGAVNPADLSAGALDVDLVLDPTEAREGSEIVFVVPLKTPCGVCGGETADRSWCMRCQSTGQYTHEHAVKLVLPPGIKDGTVTRLPLDDAGLKGLVLQLTVHIQDA